MKTQTKEFNPPLMYGGFLYRNGIYINLSTGDCFNIPVTKDNLSAILKLIDNYKH
jgi:hypothetical protein